MKNEDGMVETRHALSLKNTISSIIGSCKSVVSKNCFDWQSRFYDHIIRDEEAFSKISNYTIIILQNGIEIVLFN